MRCCCVSLLKGKKTKFAKDKLNEEMVNKIGTGKEREKHSKRTT